MYRYAISARKKKRVGRPQRETYPAIQQQAAAARRYYTPAQHEERTEL